MGNLLDDDGNVDMAAFFESSDLDYDLYLDMLEGNNNRKKNSVFQQFLKIMSSWIAPTVALLFVVSFEMGRRERLKREVKSSTEASRGGTFTDESNEAQNNSKSHGGVIQLSEEILGFGGHGTIVYKGVLDKRQVAVKRLLNMYHASADREIELLIESDGHPNVVRYFLKEMRGDFVYLALELCDLSLNDLIVSLSKLRNIRKENFHLTIGNADDVESATKSLLFQIASGVRHIHSL
jgi:serine/threonine-protein kinase/endoribonuclease IRE1